MTTKEFAKLPIGATVRWDSVYEGRIEFGPVPMFGGGETRPVKHIAWYWDGSPTGDITMGHDASAIARVTVA